MIDPLDMNRVLIQSAGDSKLHRQKARINRQLSQADPVWFQRLFAHLFARRLTYDSPVCFRLVRNFLGNGRGIELMKCFRQACFDAKSTKEHECYLVHFLLWLGHFPEWSAQILKHLTTQPEEKSTLQFLLFEWLFRGGGARVIDSARKADHVFIPDSAFFEWPVPTRYMDLATTLLDEVQGHYHIEAETIQADKEKMPDWSVIDWLWQKICQEAACSLHLDGGDYLRFSLPELEAIRLVGAQIRPNGIFPQAEVTVYVDTFGIGDQVEFQLVDGCLLGGEEYWFPYFNWLVTLAILTGYWQITSSQEEDWPVRSSHSQSTEDGLPAGFRRPAKPHRLRLPAGYQASAQAIAACRQCLGREPMPGCTFRVPKKLVALPKPKVSAVITEAAIARITTKISAA